MSCRCSPSRSSRDRRRYSVFDVSDGLRKRGWQVPAYSFPENLQDTAVLRVVVRNGMSRDLADLLVGDLKVQVQVLETHPHPPVPLMPGSTRERGGFAH